MHSLHTSHTKTSKGQLHTNMLGQTWKGHTYIRLLSALHAGRSLRVVSPQMDEKVNNVLSSLTIATAIEVLTLTNHMLSISDVKISKSEQVPYTSMLL